MKKLLWKLIMAALPVAVYLLIFIIYEPYNYWGIKPDKSGQWATPLARVREFKRNPSEYLILGDSRMNHFDADAVEDMTGLRYANLSTGGQALNLSREMYEWAKKQTTVKGIVIDASFYQVRTGNQSVTAQPVFAIAEQPLAYLTTRDYVVEVFSLFADDLQDLFKPGEPNAVSAEDHYIGKYREDLVAYAQNNIALAGPDYSIGEEQMQDITYIVDDVKRNGGKALIVCPPVQEVIWDYVIVPYELEDEMEAYKSELSRHTDVYDMEWLSDFARDQELWGDGFHLRDYGPFEKAIFTGEADFLKIRAYAP